MLLLLCPFLTLANNYDLNIGNKTIYHLLKNELDVIPEQQAVGNNMLINIDNAITQAGFYTLKLPQSNDTTSLAINYDRSESILTYWSLEELKKGSLLKNATWISGNTQQAAVVNEMQQGMPLWKVCIILALLFLLTEILLIRFMK